MQKKFVAVTLILIILINTLSSNLIYAKEFVAATYVIAANEEPQDQNKSNNPDNEATIQEQLNKNGQKMMNNLIENALVEVRSESRTRMVSVGNSTSSSPSIIAGLISTVLFVFPTIINIIITIIANMFGTTGTSTNNWFVIEDLVFNKYRLFDIDFFNIPNNLGNANTMGVLNYNIALWFFSLRNVAIVANLIILIYIGIRMAISTVAEQRARYKKMLINWFTSLFILFFMHFILAAMFTVQEWLVEILKEVLNNLEQGKGFEEAIMENTFIAIWSANGWNTITVTITIWVIVYYQLKFFFMYFRRKLSVAFLTIISPLITITYSMDAVKDGKTQIFNTWFKEMLFNIFIQIIHAIIYAVFVISAGEIAKQVPIMGAILFMSLSRAVKVVRTTMKLSSDITKSESLFKRLKKNKLF